MRIDIERLKHDAEYWKSVCSDKCVCCYVVFAFGDPSNYRKVEFHDSWDDFVYATQGNQVMCIPRPTKPSAPEWDGSRTLLYGDKCEACTCAGTDNPAWVKGFYKGNAETSSGRTVSLFESFDGTNHVIERSSSFRPIRTKEQREREELRRELMKTIDQSPINPHGFASMVNIDNAADAILERYELKERDK